MKAKLSAFMGKLAGFYKKYSVIFLLLLVAAAVVLPLVVTSTYYRSIFVRVLLYSLLASSLNMINGYSGQFNIGHIGFYCIGAYVYALCCKYFGMSFWVLLPLAGIIAAVFGYLISLPTLRLKGMYLAMVTLGASEIIRLIVISWKKVTLGSNGITGVPVPVAFGVKLGDTLAFYYIILALLVIMLFVSYRVLHSRVGSAWMAIREDQNAAAFLGVEVAKYKSMNFMYGAFWAGVAGCFCASYYQYITPEMFNADKGNEILSMVILGGQGTLVGPIIGAVTTTVLTEGLRFSDQYRMLIYAVLIIAMMWFRPQGLAGARNSVFAAKSTNSKKSSKKKEVVK